MKRTSGPAPRPGPTPAKRSPEPERRPPGRGYQREDGNWPDLPDRQRNRLDEGRGRGGRPPPPATVTSSMVRRSEDPRVRSLLIGDGRNLGKSRQRKWQRALLQLKVIKEIPGTNPQLYEAGSAIGRAAELTPYRGDFADSLAE